MVEAKNKNNSLYYLIILMLLLLVCPLSMSLFFNRGINRSADAIAPKIKSFFSERGSYGYLVVNYDYGVKINNTQFYKDLLTIQQKYPSSKKNTFVKGRIFPIYSNNYSNNFNINGVNDFKVVLIPGMENIDYDSEQKTVSYDVSYLGTKLSFSPKNTGYQGVFDSSELFFENSLYELISPDLSEDNFFTIGDRALSFKNGGSIGYFSGEKDRSNEIKKLCDGSYIFAGFEYIKYFKQESIVFEISNSRQIDYGYTSLDEDGKTKLDPLTFIIDNYLNDIVSFVNKYNYSHITVYKSIGKENSEVVTNTEKTLELESYITKYIQFYRKPVSKILGVLYLLFFLLSLIIVVSLIAFICKANVFNFENHLFLKLLSFLIFVFSTGIFVPLVMNNLSMFKTFDIKLLGQQYCTFLFFYFGLMALISFVVYKRFSINKVVKNNEN